MPSSFAPGISRLRGTLRAIGLASVFALTAAAAGLGQDAKHNFLMRFPDVHGDKVVFVAGGHLDRPGSGRRRRALDDARRR